MTSWFAIVPVVVLGISALAALVIMLLPEHARRARSITNLSAAGTKFAILLALAPFVFSGTQPALGWDLLPGLRIELRADPLSMLFALLSSTLWLLTTIYAIGYMRKDAQQRRFFAFFSLCVTATVGIAFSGNLVTFLIFYELLTLVTYPLVSHNGSAEALKAARTYLMYALCGGLFVLVGTVLLHGAAGTTTFEAGGSSTVAALAQARPELAIAIFGFLIIGFGVKAALVPLHGWLPLAMVAPAPVSALLHAVAVVKAGAFGIVRVVSDLFGADVATSLGVLDILLVWASVTILYGSLRATFQQDLKRRLAYSTVSQVSYVVLGMAMVASTATVGGITHLFHQGITKIVLFFCAGLFAERLGAKTVRSLEGIGQRMPWTAIAFTVGAFGMIGLPPLAGFVSKWTLGIGALESDRGWVIAVLMASAALNCGYFLPIVYRMWWPTAHAPDHQPQPLPIGAMVTPTVIVAGLTIAAGVLAFTPFSPLGMAEQIIQWGHR